jgi:integrase/recombinase XerD
MTALAPILQAFFTDRLARQRHANGHTIAAYRDTWRLLLGYASGKARTPPSLLDLADLDAPLIAAFLDHLEADRGNSARTRNARLAAIHSVFRHVALRHPEHAEIIARVLAIPSKRFDKALVTWLTETEIAALLAAPDPVRLGRTPRPCPDPARRPDRPAHLRAHRAQHRGCPPRRRRARLLHRQGPQAADHPAHRRDRSDAPHLARRTRRPARPVAVPNRTGGRLSRDAIEHRLAKHIAVGAARCPSLNTKKVTMHTLRHTAAMRLLQAGIDTSVIALWMGHEQAETTQIYLNSRELHQTGEKPQVPMSGRYSSGLSRVLGMAA